MSFEKRIRDINKAYVERSLKIGGSRMIGAGATINDFYPNKHLGIAVGGARPSQNLTAEEKKERARLSAEKFRNKKKGNLVSNEEVNEPVSEEEGEQPEEKHITKQVYKNKHNKRIEVIQTIDVKTMDDKPRKLKKTINGGKKAIKKGGYSWEKFLDDADETTQTAARVARPFLFGLGKVKGKKKGKKGGAKEKDLYSGEPTQNLTIQHLRDKKKDIYTPDGVLISQYTPPEMMRDQSIRPDMPLDQTEVVKPPPEHHLTQWQAFKKGMMIIPHAIGALLGGEQPEQPKRKGRKGKKGGNQFKNFFEGKSQTPKPPKPSEGILTKPKTSLLSVVLKQINDKNKPPAPIAPAPPAPTTGAGKKTSKWVDFVKAYSKKHNMKYNEALKDSKCKSEYHNSK